MPDRERPTLAELQELYQDLKDRVFAKAHAEMRIDQDFILWTSTENDGSYAHYLRGFPKEYKPLMLPLGKNYVGRGATQIVHGETPDVKVIMPGGKRRSQKNVEDQREAVRNWMGAWWWQVGQRMRMPVVQAVKHGLGLGVAPIKYPYLPDQYPQAPQHGKRSKKDKDAWAKYEHDVQHAWPWQVSAVHPLNIMFDPDHEEPEYFFETTQVSKRIAKKEYGIEAITARPSGDAGATTHELIVYVDADFYGCWVNWQPILTAEDGADKEGIMENTLGYAWYGVALSGFGDEDETGDLVYQLKGMVRDGRNLIVARTEDFNVTQQLKLMAAQGTLKATGQGPDGKAKAEEESRDWVFGPGRVITSSNEVEAGFMEPPQVPDVVLQNMDMVQHLEDLTFGPDVLAGAYRDEPLGSLRVRRSQALAPFQAMKANIEQLMAAVSMNILKSIKDEIKGPVTVWAGRGENAMPYTLKPEDIWDGIAIEIDVAPMTEEDRSYIWETKKDQHAEGAISDDRLMREGAGIENVEDEQKAIFKASLRKGAAQAAAEVVAMVVQNSLQQAALPPQNQVVPPGEAAPAGPPQGAPMPMQPPGPPPQPNYPDPLAGGPMEAMQNVQQSMGLPPIIG